MKTKNILIIFIFVLVLLIFSKFSFASDIIIKTNITVGCGDGNCTSEYGETCSSCPEDCGSCITTTAPSIGGGGRVITTSSTSSTTPSTTIIKAIIPSTTTKILPEMICGNRVCETGENCGNCLKDCPCRTGEECKNNVCTPVITPPSSPATTPTPLGVWFLVLTPIIGITIYLIYMRRKKNIVIK